MIEFDVIFEGARVPTWLRVFERAPAEAIEDLLVGRADLGLLSAEEPSTLLLDWLAGIGDRDGFAREIDEALASWIDRSWGNPTLARANQSASLTAVAWCRAADVIALDERLDNSADRLRQQVIKDRRFLNALHEGRGRDPMGRAWLAIARHQQDRSLVDQWWRLCSLPPDEPWHRGTYGIHGLRGLPPADASKKGGFAEEVAEGLAMLGGALWRRQKDGWLQEKLAENEFTRTARMTIAAYPFPKDWQAFWRHAVDRPHNQAPRDWVKKFVRLLPSETKDIRRKHSAQARSIPRDLQWPQRGQRIAARLAHSDWSALSDAEELLKAEQLYAEATGNTYDVVRSACNFAGRVRRQRPGLSLKWAELARHFAPWNDYACSISASALLTLGRHHEAMTLALQTIERFPENVVARTGLAEVLKAQQRFDDAESVYRETIERFPENAFARTGLAGVLKAQQRFDDAESVYRETIERFPEDVVARNGLAEVLKAQQRFDEAEPVYRETIERFPEDVFARTGLAEVLKAQQRFDDAESVYRETSERFSEDAVTRNGLAEVLKAQQRFDDAESVYRETIERFPENAFARNGLAEVLKAQQRFDDAESVYRETIEQFPDDVVARNGLAEVLKAQQRFDEAESVYRATIERFPENVVARNGLANLLGATGRFEEAAALLVDVRETAEETRKANPTGSESLPLAPETHQPVDAPKSTGALSSEEVDVRASVRKTVEEARIAKPTGSESLPLTPETHQPVDPPKSTGALAPEEVVVPAASAEDLAAPSPGLLADDISILLADAYLLRKWQSQALRRGGQQSTGVIHDRARKLLEDLMPLIGRDSRSASEAGLLTIAQGDLEHAVQFLVQASERFRGSVRVHYALARAQRELARVQQRALSAEAQTEVIVPWRRLSRVDEHCRPVQLLGEGRAWLTLSDGATVEEHAREAFGRLGHWLKRQIEPTDREVNPNATPMEQIRDRFAPREGVDRFFGWWAREVQTYVFGEEPISRAEDLEQLAPIRQRIVQHSRILDQIEEECVARFDRA